MAIPAEPWYPGGTERVAAEISLRLRSADYDLTLIGTGKRPGVYRWKGLNVIIYKSYTDAYGISPTLLRDLKTNDFDLIHAHGFTTFIPLAISIKKLLHGNTKVLFHPHYHHHGSNVVFDKLRFLYDPLMSSFFFRETDFLVACSRAELSLINRKLKPNLPSAVVYDGVDVDKIRKANPYSFDGKLFLYVGRLEKYKNIHFAIRAMKYLPNEYKFYIIGKGPFENALRNLAQSLKLEDRVIFLGYQPDEVVYRWLSTCNLFVHLSEIEAFGMTCIEAMATDKPVIVNDDNFGLRETAEIFPEAIRMVPVKSISAKRLAEFMEEQCSSTIKADIVPFSWTKITERFSNLYNLILS
jgi:glycosyltransferase involved in cell wall biosynthesis